MLEERNPVRAFTHRYVIDVDSPEDEEFHAERFGAEELGGMVFEHFDYEPVEMDSEHIVKEIDLVVMTREHYDRLKHTEAEHNAVC